MTYPLIRMIIDQEVSSVTKNEAEGTVNSNFYFSLFLIDWIDRESLGI